jgi:hypothetical protein
MANNEKPIVFLSHSSLDKAPLTALKQMLDERAAGALDFFLSSDGESIRFGRNWVVRVSDALSKAKLMFVFLSPHSADSKWIHFEAGCAYAKDIDVVPVCLPGIDLNSIKPPLSLLQGFNLHSHDAMGNLSRICNDSFDMKIKESFSEADFDAIMTKLPAFDTGFFGELCQTISYVTVWSHGLLPDESFSPLENFNEKCTKAGLNCHFSIDKFEATPHGQILSRATLDLPGCVGTFTISKPSTTNRQPGTPNVNVPAVESPKKYYLEFKLSPELFHVNAPLLDEWIREKRFSSTFEVSVQFHRDIRSENERLRLTTKLYKCGIATLGVKEKSGYSFNGFKFNLNRVNGSNLWFLLETELYNRNLFTLIKKLFDSEVFWIHEPGIGEMLGSYIPRL